MTATTRYLEPHDPRTCGTVVPSSRWPYVKACPYPAVRAVQISRAGDVWESFCSIHIRVEVSA